MSGNEILVGLLGLLSSTGIAGIGLWLNSRNEETAQETIASAQVYSGYGGLLQEYRDDNADLRRRNAELEQRNVELLERLGERGG